MSWGCLFDFMILRSGKIVTMPKDEGAEGGVTVVSHQFTNHKSGIEPFAGRINGELKQGVEVFIESVEYHLQSKGITNGEAQFVEAKCHLNLSQGDLGDCTRSIFFRDCRTWEDLKGFLRDTYGSGKTRDVVLDLRRVLKLHDRKGNSFMAQNAKVNDATVDFISKLTNSDWVDCKPQGAISLKNVGRLLHLAVGLHSLPDALVNAFDTEFTPKSTERQVMEQINRHLPNMQVADSTILNGTPKGTSRPNTVLGSQNSCNRIDRNPAGTRKPVSGGVTSYKRAVKCFNCEREGHAKKDCNVRYCSFHQSSTHNWKNCNALNSQNQFPPLQRQKSFSRERGYDNANKQGGQNRGDSGRWGDKSSSPRRGNFSRQFQKDGRG